MNAYQTFTGTINAVHQSKPFTSTSTGKPVVLHSLYLYGVTGAFRHGEQPVPASVGDEVTFQARPAPNKPGQFYVVAGSLRKTQTFSPEPTPAKELDKPEPTADAEHARAELRRLLADLQKAKSVSYEAAQKAQDAVDAFLVTPAGQLV